MPQDVTPIDLRQIQVQHENLRCWSIRLRFKQERHCLFTITTNEEIAFDAVGLEGFSEKVNVGRAVFGEENRGRFKHTGTA